MHVFEETKFRVETQIFMLYFTLEKKNKKKILFFKFK